MKLVFCIILIFTYICSFAATNVYAQQNKHVLLGINFTHYKIDVQKKSECKTKGPESTMRGGAIVTNYTDPVVRAQVRTLMLSMRRSGFDSLRTIIGYRSMYPADTASGMLQSGGPGLKEPGLTNISAFAEDVAAAGFKRLTVALSPQGENNPYCKKVEWGDCYIPATFEDNWQVIRGIRTTVASKIGKKLDLIFEIWQEGCPSIYLQSAPRQAASDYIIKIIKHYNDEFGSKDLLVSCADDMNPDDRLVNLLNLYDKAGVKPHIIGFHPYEINKLKLDTFFSVMNNIAKKRDLDIVIGETFYHNSALTDSAETFFKLNPDHRFKEFIQWPLKDFSSGCHFDTPPPYTPGVFLKLSPQQ